MTFCPRIKQRTLGLACACLLFAWLAAPAHAQNWQLGRETLKDPEYGHDIVVPVLLAGDQIVRYHQPKGWRLQVDGPARKLVLVSTNAGETITLQKLRAPTKQFTHDQAILWILKQYPQASTAEDLSVHVQGKPALGCRLVLEGGVEIKTVCLPDKEEWWVVTSRRPTPRDPRNHPEWNLFVRGLNFRERNAPDPDR